MCDTHEIRDIREYCVKSPTQIFKCESNNEIDIFLKKNVLIDYDFLCSVNLNERQPRWKIPD